MAIANRGDHGDGKEERVDETPVDVLALVAVAVDEVIVASHQ